MPLSRIQSDILRLLAAHRDPESYVAGSMPLNVNAPRYSADIDVFHDREERVARAVLDDTAVLLADVVDLLTVHDRVLPLGAVVWAAVGKPLGFTPEGLIDEICRARYTEADFRRLASDPPVGPAATMTRLRDILDEAATFVERMPSEQAGLLLLREGVVLQPDPDRLGSYQPHAVERRGHWPSGCEISAAMLERYHRQSMP